MHRDFPIALLVRCPSGWLRGFGDTPAKEAYRFRQVAADKRFTKRNEDTKHEATFEVAIAGRADEAVRLLSEHCARTSALVVKQARRAAEPA